VPKPSAHDHYISLYSAEVTLTMCFAGFTGADNRPLKKKKKTEKECVFPDDFVARLGCLA